MLLLKMKMKIKFVLLFNALKAKATGGKRQTGPATKQTPSLDETVDWRAEIGLEGPKITSFARE